MTTQPQTFASEPCDDQPPASGPVRRQPSSQGSGVTHLAGGEQLTLTPTAHGQRLTLCSPEGQALVEYDTHTGCLRVCGPVTRVSLDSTAADVELRSAGNLSLSAEGAIHLSSAAGVTLEVNGSDGRPTACARVAPYGMTFAARQLTWAADSARFNLRRAEIRGEQLRAIWSKASLTSARLELQARDVRTKAHNVMQDIEESLSIKAGRVRQWIRGSHHTHAERSELLAREDVRIDGKTINLG